MNRAVVISRVCPHEPSCPIAGNLDEDSQPSSWRARVGQDPTVRVALVSPTQLALQHFHGSHGPSMWPHREASVARLGREPTWELARAIRGARTLTPLSINCGSLSWSWRPPTASLTLCSPIFQSEEGGNPPPPPSTTHLGLWGKFSL